MTKSTYLFHVIVLPILIYAGWVAYTGRCATQHGLYLFVIGVTVVGLVYHTLKLTSVI